MEPFAKLAIAFAKGSMHWLCLFLLLAAPFNLETAVGPRKKVQDFESESLTIGVEHSQKVKATPSVSDYGSKDCAFCPDPTAVSRLNRVSAPR